MAGRPSTPDEEPPRERAGAAGLLAGSLPAVAAIAFAVVIVVVLVAILA